MKGVTVELRTLEPGNLESAFLQVPAFIIQQIVTLFKYGHDALDICHP